MDSLGSVFPPGIDDGVADNEQQRNWESLTCRFNISDCWLSLPPRTRVVVWSGSASWPCEVQVLPRPAALSSPHSPQQVDAVVWFSYC